MAEEEKAKLRFEIGHVLFIDIVGYSKLLLDEQKERLRQLTDIVLACPQVGESTNEQLVRVPTGDGMALVFRNSSEEPARCALEIAESLKAHPEVLVRMGIHSGPVSEVIDVNGHKNVAGAGINIAQRAMDCGDAGHILLSQRVAEDLAQYRQWAAQLHDLGECEVKHGTRLRVFNLHGDTVGNAQLPQKFRQRKTARATKLWMTAIPSVVIFAVVGALLYYRAHQSKALTDKDRIVLADFTNTTGDPVFDGTLRQGLASQLQQTPFLTLVSDSSIAQTLTLMSKPRDARLTPELAREVGQRIVKSRELRGWKFARARTGNRDREGTSAQRAGPSGNQDAEKTGRIAGVSQEVRRTAGRHYDFITGSAAGLCPG
jgi:class 3 adenylate cyclase